MLELKKVTVAKEEEKAHICMPCYWCLPWICAITEPDDVD